MIILYQTWYVQLDICHPGNYHWTNFLFLVVCHNLNCSGLIKRAGLKNNVYKNTSSNIYSTQLFSLKHTCLHPLAQLDLPQPTHIQHNVHKCKHTWAHIGTHTHWEKKKENHCCAVPSPSGTSCPHPSPPPASPFPSTRPTLPLHLPHPSPPPAPPFPSTRPTLPLHPPHPSPPPAPSFPSTRPTPSSQLQVPWSTLATMLCSPERPDTMCLTWYTHPVSGVFWPETGDTAIPWYSKQTALKHCCMLLFLARDDSHYGATTKAWNTCVVKSCWLWSTDMTVTTANKAGLKHLCSHVLLAVEYRHDCDYSKQGWPGTLV